jgi:hypothetical protein
MNGSESETLAWSRGRWWGAFLLVMFAQVGLIFSLSNRKPLSSREADLTTTFDLVVDAPSGSAIAEWLSIEDPALFALPDVRAFSGLAWMTAPALSHQSVDWTEPPRWLSLSVNELGLVFTEFVRTNVVGPRVLADRLAPQTDRVTVPPLPLTARSRLRLGGDLAGRELLAPLELPSIPHAEILTDTVVQVSVSRQGVPFAPVLLSGSGSPDADRQALEQVKAIRLRPLANTSEISPRGQIAFNLGQMIFQWHTLEMRGTNAPTAQIPP